MAIILSEENNLRKVVFANPTFDIENKVIKLKITKQFHVFNGVDWVEVEEANKNILNISAGNDRLVDISTELYADDLSMYKTINSVSDIEPVDNLVEGYKYLNTIDNKVYVYRTTINEEEVEVSSFVEVVANHDKIIDGDGIRYVKVEGVYGIQYLIGAYDYFTSFKGSDLGMSTTDDYLFPLIAAKVESFIQNNYDLSSL